MKKVYRLIVKDTLNALKKDEHGNYDELFKFCTLDEVEEVIRNFKGDDSTILKLKTWLEGKRNEMAQFINYVNSSSFSEHYLDNNYSTDFLNSLRRFLGFEVRFYKDKMDNVDQIEFILDDNEIRIDSIISDSIKRQRNKNSRLRGYQDLDEEKKYQYFYREFCLQNAKNNKTKAIKEVINENKKVKKKIESSLQKASQEDIQTIIQKDRDSNYSETKEQLLELIESYGYTKEMIDTIDFSDKF